MERLGARDFTVSGSWVWTAGFRVRMHQLDLCERFCEGLAIVTETVQELQHSQPRLDTKIQSI